jgi:hypothetical protein
MYKNILLVVGVLFLIMLDVAFILLNKGLKSKLNALEYSYEVLFNQDSLKCKMFEENILQYSSNSGKKLDENLELVSENGQKTTFKELTLKRPVIIFKYFQESCHSCIENEFRIMKEVFSEDELQKIIIITTEKEAFKLNRIKRMNQINNHLYTINDKDKGLPVDELRAPYMFVINDSYYVENLFIPVKFNTATSITYYKHIKQLYLQ